MNKDEERAWLVSLAKYAVMACRAFGAFLPSVLLAQAALETGFGRGAGCASLMENWNLLGMKKELLNKTWTSSYWTGKTFEKVTPEYVGGKRIEKVDVFRSYTSALECFCDYLQFLRDAKYSVNGTYKYRDVLQLEIYEDPYTLISTVSGRGYCTDPSYTKSVMSIIGRHPFLLDYDKEAKKMPTVVKPASVAEFLGRYGRTLVDRIAVNRNKGQRHNCNTHKYLAIHFLGVCGENADLYDGCYGGTYYVSKTGQAYQAADVGDRLWHVGASSGFRYIHPDARNDNTIGIEVATYTESGRNDDNEPWYYTEASQRTLVILISGICLVYGIPLDHVLMHGQITTKICPAPYLRWANKGPNWSWDALMARVAACMAGTYDEGAAAPAPVTVTVLRYGHTGSAVKKLQENLIALGYSCGSAGADGILGYDTANAVRLFQDDHHLTVDGLAGPITLKELANAIDAKNAPKAEEESGVTWLVQIGAYGKKTNAQARLQAAQAAGFDAILKDYGKDAPAGTRWHVQNGAFASKTRAEALAKRLTAAGLDSYVQPA